MRHETPPFYSVSFVSFFLKATRPVTGVVYLKHNSTNHYGAWSWKVLDLWREPYEKVSRDRKWSNN